MATEIDLHLRREPAQRVGSVAFGRLCCAPDRPVGDQEGGFRDVVLSGDRGKRCIGQPVRQHDDGRRIAAEHLAGEGVDLP